MSLSVADETTSKIADKKTYRKKDSSRIKRNLSLMLVEFNVIPYVIGFGIALSIQNFLLKFGEYIVRRILKIKNDLLVSFMVIVMMLMFCYVLIYFIFFRYIYTEDISRETRIKKAISQHKTDEAQKEISEDKELIKTIQKDIDLISEEKIKNIVEEYKYY